MSQRVRDMSDQELENLYIEVQNEKQFRINQIAIQTAKDDFIRAFDALKDPDNIDATYLELVSALDSTPYSRKETAVMKETVGRFGVVYSELRNGTVNFTISKKEVFHSQDIMVTVEGVYSMAKSTPSHTRDVKPVLATLDIKFMTLGYGGSLFYESTVHLNPGSGDSSFYNHGWTQVTKNLHDGFIRAFEENLHRSASELIDRSRC